MIDFDVPVKGLELIHEAYAQSRGPRVIDILTRLYPGEGEAVVILGGPQLVTSGVIIYRAAGVARVFIAGINGTVQALRVIAGYSDPRAISQAGNTNFYFRADAGEIWGDDLTRVLRPGDRLELHGHSAGGGVCEVLANIVRTAFHRMPISIDTYGAPAAAYRDSLVPADLVDRRRWMMNQDPVPLVPWIELSAGRYLLTILYSQLWVASLENLPQPERFVQPEGGLRIANRSLDAGYQPRIVGDIQALMQAWLDQDGDAADSHDAGTYLIVMRSLRDRYPDGADDPTNRQVGAIGPVPQVRLVVPFVRIEEPEVNFVLPIVIEANGVALNPLGGEPAVFSLERTPMSFLKINPKKAFRRVKVGNTWNVVIGERVVMVCDSPKVPRTIVKRLNGMLRAVGTDNTVFLQNLLDGLSDWMAAAASDQTYSRPLMRVDL